MNPGDARRNEALEWLAKAAEDLASARILLDAGHPGTALFHCQQSAEKCLKGFLTWHDQPFRKTHNIEEVGLACIALDLTLTDVFGKLEYLAPSPGGYAIPDRGTHRNPRKAPRCGIWPDRFWKRSNHGFRPSSSLSTRIGPHWPSNRSRHMEKQCLALRFITGRREAESAWHFAFRA